MLFRISENAPDKCCNQNNKDDNISNNEINLFANKILLHVYIYVCVDRILNCLVATYKILISMLLLPKKNVFEWEITKTEVGNEMEIFITLTKYNTR